MQKNAEYGHSTSWPSPPRVRAAEIPCHHRLKPRAGVFTNRKRRMISHDLLKKSLNHEPEPPGGRFKGFPGTGLSPGTIEDYPDPMVESALPQNFPGTAQLGSCFDSFHRFFTRKFPAFWAKYTSWDAPGQNIRRGLFHSGHYIGRSRCW